jgi:hypothetical protein
LGTFYILVVGRRFPFFGKEKWMITAGFEPTISASSIRYTLLQETFFLRSTTYTRNIKWQAIIKTGTAGSVVKLKLVLTKLFKILKNL